MSSVIQTIAQQIEGRKSFSPTAIQRAQEAIADTYAVMVAGKAEAATQAVRAAFSADISTYYSASTRAMVDATAAHSLDFDDNFHPARAHASAVLVPALLAASRLVGATSGSQLVSAYLAGLEAQAAVGFGVVPSHYNLGWHGTSTIGSIGAAAGVSHLLGLSLEEMVHAMSIATSLACGPKGQFGTMVKPVHAGFAARNAVDSALLAKAGLRGRADILEGKQGFLELTGGPEARGWDGLTFGPEHVIETRGLVTKRHPCCASTHRAVDALLDLKQDHQLSFNDIDRIVAKVGVSAAKNLAYPDPEDEMQARFSMQYCLATAFTTGRLALSDFTPEVVRQRKCAPLMGRIEMVSYTPEDERGWERLPHIVTVITRDGQHLVTERLHAKGAIEAPMDENDRYQKFMDCLAWAGMEKGGSDSKWQAVCQLSHTTNVVDVLGMD
ncbi:MmgE/PrpD family protein [Devosia elaeis]|uniref:2-methylcitrate dehydratase n=1 Tax=Devosia elaeis TaxID=1770058 RepID=A0A178HWX0_9HYPH|nr:MmgE/PrpD family protein [Devosia elaeis]OAM76950.1 2-methylcitrate dehydratase [Devosia elaeis]